jgi:3-isopropylmalate/(R)-2-methylmalate dehydratase large subunit
LIRPAYAGRLQPFSLYSEQSHQVMKPRTLYDKIWDDHLVDEQPDGTCLIYVDRHLVHEVTSPQAFEGLRAAGRKVHAPDRTLAVATTNANPAEIPTRAEQIIAAENATSASGIS